MRIFLLLILLVSIAAIAFALVFPDWSDIFLLAIPLAIASGILLLRALRHPAQHPEKPPKKTLVVDGSNAMFWQDNTPKIETVVALTNLLKSKDYRVLVIFDASAGHVLFGHYLDDAPFAELLGLPAEDCFVVPKGTIADELILKAARNLGARIVTNDRYRDWAEQFPEVRKPGYLIKGHFEKGAIHLHRLAPRQSKST